MDEVKEVERVNLEPAPPETANDDERTLVERFSSLKLRVDELDTALKIATKECEETEARLMKLLEDDEKKCSAKYQGLGHVTIVEGKGYSAIEKGRQEDVLGYLKEIGRDDMIKTTVHSATLTAFVNQCLKQNEPLPPGVTHYRPKWLNFYKAK